MKTKTFFLSLLFLVTANCFAQYSIDGDTILSTISKSLPKGWSMRVSFDTLIIERTDSVYQVVGLLPDSVKQWTDSTPTATMKAYMVQHMGNTKKYGFRYRLEPKWSKQKFMRTRQHNDTMRRQMVMLPGKFDLRRLFAHNDSVPPNSKYKSPAYKYNTPADSLARIRYATERDSLQALKKPLPNKKSENYSLFEMAPYLPPNSPMMFIYPVSATNERDAINRLMGRCNMPFF